MLLRQLPPLLLKTPIGTTATIMMAPQQVLLQPTQRPHSPLMSTAHLPSNALKRCCCCSLLTRLAVISPPSSSPPLQFLHTWRPPKRSSTRSSIICPSPSCRIADYSVNLWSCCSVASTTAPDTGSSCRRNPPSSSWAFSALPRPPSCRRCSRRSTSCCLGTTSGCCFWNACPPTSSGSSSTRATGRSTPT